MNGITLETLKVVLQAQYSGYQQDMEKVKEATRQVSEKVETEKKKINNSLNTISTATARKEVQRLQDTLAKQSEAVAAQEAVIANLRNQYQNLMDGITEDKAVSGLEKQLKAAEKELTVLDQKLQPLLDKLTEAEEFAGAGLQLPGMEEVYAQIDAINPKYDELENKVARLRQQLSEMRMDPASTTQAQQLQQEIALAESKLQRLKDTSADTNTKLQQMMNQKGTLQEKLSSITNRVRALKSESGKTTSAMQSGFEKVTGKIDQLRKRLTGLVTSALVFNVISKGIRSLRDSTYEYLKTDQEFAAALNQIQTNLKVAFAPLYEWVLPGLNTLMEKLASASQTVAVFVSALFGKTYEQSYQAALGLEQAKDALESYSTAASKTNNLASFDRLNNVTTTDSSSSSSTSALSSITGEVAGLSDQMQTVLEKVQEFKDRLKEIGEDFKLGDWFKAGSDISDLIIWINEGIAGLIEGLDSESAGKKFGQFLKGIKWLEILKSIKDVIVAALEAAASFWFASLKEAPFETALITGMTLWKFTKLGKTLGGTIGTAIIGGVLAAIGGFEVGKEIGKLLFPDDAEWYDSFHWTGEGGFFDTISSDWASAWDGLMEMASDWENNPVIAALTNVLGGPFISMSASIHSVKKDLENLDIGGWFENSVKPWLTKEKWSELGENIKSSLHDKSEEFFSWWEEKGAPDWFTASVSPLFTLEKWSELGENIKSGLRVKVEDFFSWWEETGVSKWVNDSVKPWFSKEKWEEVSAGMKEGLTATCQKAVAAGIEVINKLIDWINEKLHIKWDPLTIAGKELFPGVDVQLFTIPHISIPQYASGGLVPKGQIFQAREDGPELVASFGGSTGVMNNDQIVQSVADGVENGTYRAMSSVLLLLQEMLVLIQTMAENQSSDSEGYNKEKVFTDMQAMALKYYKRTGNPAF